MKEVALLDKYVYKQRCTLKSEVSHGHKTALSSDTTKREGCLQTVYLRTATEGNEKLQNQVVQTCIKQWCCRLSAIYFYQIWFDPPIIDECAFLAKKRCSFHVIERPCATLFQILGITNPKGEKKYIAAAFPSACGKTNLAMLQPTLPGYKVECVGDDIAWMKFDSEGRLRAINPEAGFFGVAPGTSMRTNPNAMLTIAKNTIFTNVGITGDSGYFWEGLEKEIDPKTVPITTWKNQAYNPSGKDPAAHPNSRFCTPARQCPIMDADWESPEGVPIDAILFGGRRPVGVPLVYESFSWQHGVFLGAAMRSEATAAAEHKGKVIMHDPFAMRPFFGYNFGRYIKHWLSFAEKPSLKLPRVYHVNWFRKNENGGGFLWPGFGENVRVLDWICRRVNGEDCAQESPIGNIPSEGSLNISGLNDVDMKQLFSVPKDFWTEEVEEIKKYFDEQVNDDLPQAVTDELNALRERVKKA